MRISHIRCDLTEYRDVSRGDRRRNTNMMRLLPVRTTLPIVADPTDAASGREPMDILPHSVDRQRMCSQHGAQLADPLLRTLQRSGNRF